MFLAQGISPHHFFIGSSFIQDPGVDLALLRNVPEHHRGVARGRRAAQQSPGRKIRQEAWQPEAAPLKDSVQLVKITRENQGEPEHGDFLEGK